MFVFCCLGCCNCSADSLSASNLFSTLKEFLQRDAEEYEVIYSVTQNSNEQPQKSLQAINTQKNTQIRVAFDVPWFFRVRRSKDGYFVHKADSFRAIESLDLSGATDYAHGVTWNADWNISNKILIFNDSKDKESNNSQEKAWTNSANEAIQNMLSLGLWIRKGSVVWEVPISLLTQPILL